MSELRASVWELRESAWELCASVGLMSGVVLLSGACRRGAARFCSGAVGRVLLEAASTFQLCACCHELKLLGDAAQLEPWAALTLCFAVTSVHLLTLGAADCHPGASVEKVVRGSSSGRTASLLIAAQFAAAVAAQYFAAAVWSLGLSDLHARHRRFGFRCFDPLGGTVLEAAAVELACAFVFQAVLMHVPKLDETLRVPVVAATVTGLTHAGE